MMYDASLGRFLQRDPLGSLAGSADLYAYVDDMPTNAVDPSGLIPARPGRSPTFTQELQCLALRAELLRRVDALIQKNNNLRNLITQALGVARQLMTLADRNKLPAVKSNLNGLIAYLSHLSFEAFFDKFRLDVYRDEINNLKYERCDPESCLRQAAVLREDLEDMGRAIDSNFRMFLILWGEVEAQERRINPPPRGMQPQRP
jgi:hypothetical protein